MSSTKKCKRCHNRFAIFPFFKTHGCANWPTVWFLKKIYYIFYSPYLCQFIKFGWFFEISFFLAPPLPATLWISSLQNSIENMLHHQVPLYINYSLLTWLSSMTCEDPWVQPWPSWASRPPPESPHSPSSRHSYIFFHLFLTSVCQISLPLRDLPESCLQILLFVHEFIHLVGHHLLGSVTL